MKTDIFDELYNSYNENKYNTILKYSAFIIFIAGFIAIMVAIFFTWYNNNKINKIYQDEALLFEAIKIIENPINFNAKKGEIITSDKGMENMDNGIEKLEELFKNGTTTYSAMAGNYLANIALKKGNYSKTIYYYKQIIDNDNYDISIRNYAKLLLLDIKLNYENISAEDELPEALKYFDVKAGIKADSKFYAKYDSVIPFSAQFNILNTALLIENKKYEVSSEILNDIITSYSFDEEAVKKNKNDMSFIWKRNANHGEFMHFVKNSLEYVNYMKSYQAQK